MERPTSSGSNQNWPVVLLVLDELCDRSNISVTVDLIGIEPTTSSVQTRRSPDELQAHNGQAVTFYSNDLRFLLEPHLPKRYVRSVGVNLYKSMPTETRITASHLVAHADSHRVLATLDL